MFLSRRREAAFFIKLLAGERGVRRAFFTRAFFCARAGGDDAFTHLFRRFAAREFCERIVRNKRHFYPEIQAVNDGP